MTDFESAFKSILQKDGGFIDSPYDQGGATHFGLSLRFLRSLPVETLRRCGIFNAPESLTIEHLKELTQEQAKLIYKLADLL